MNYGERIKKYCVENNLSYENFAELIGASRRQVYRWVGGTSTPCGDSKAKLNCVLGIKSDEIFYSDNGKDDFILSPQPKNEKRYMSFYLSENTIKLIEEMCETTNQRNSYVLTKAIEFAYAHWNGN